MYNNHCGRCEQWWHYIWQEQAQVNSPCWIIQFKLQQIIVFLCVLLHANQQFTFFFFSRKCQGESKHHFTGNTSFLAFKSLPRVIRYYQMTTYNLCLANETQNGKCHSPRWLHFQKHRFSWENSVMCCCHSSCMVWCLMQGLPIIMPNTHTANNATWPLEGHLQSTSYSFHTVCTLRVLCPESRWNRNVCHL